jgi:hypothetical protein
MAEGPAHIESHVRTTAGSLFHMMDYCITTNYLLSYFSEPGMVREPFQAQLDMEWNNGALTKTINIPLVKS